MTANIPGIKARHAIITPHCRIVQGGNIEAFEVAVGRLKEEYVACVALECNQSADFLPLGTDHRQGRGKPMKQSIKDIQNELILADAHIPTAKISNLLAFESLGVVKWRDPGSLAWLPAGEAKKFIKWFIEGDNFRRTNASRERAWSGSHKRKFERVWKRALRKARGNLEAARLGEIAEVKEAIKEFQELIKATPHWQLKRLKQKELAQWQAHLKSLEVAEVPPGFSPVVQPPFDPEPESPAAPRIAPPTWRRTGDGVWANLKGRKAPDWCKRIAIHIPDRRAKIFGVDRSIPLAVTYLLGPVRIKSEKMEWRGNHYKLMLTILQMEKLGL